MTKPPISVPTESRPTEHELVGIVDGWRCSCGERMSHSPDWMTAKNEHNKHVAASSSLLPVGRQLEPKHSAPEVLDYATGVQGSYTIRRIFKWGPSKLATAEFWNPSGWSASGYVINDRKLADAICNLLASLPVGQSPKDDGKHFMTASDHQLEANRFINQRYDHIMAQMSGNGKVEELARQREAGEFACWVIDLVKDRIDGKEPYDEIKAEFLKRYNTLAALRADSTRTQEKP